MPFKKALITNVIVVVAALAYTNNSHAAACATKTWAVGGAYNAGDVVSAGGHNYQIIQPHTAYAGNWTPQNTPALWKDLGSCTSQTSPGTVAQPAPAPSPAPVTPPKSNPAPIEQPKPRAAPAPAPTFTTGAGDNLVFVNRCGYPVVVGKTWDAPLKTIPGGDNFVHNLGPEGTPKPAIAFYAYREGRNAGAGNITLAEFTLNQGGVDYYDVSIVDGFSVPMTIEPLGTQCPIASCDYDVISACPDSAKIMQDGQVIACSKKGDKDNPNNPLTKLIDNFCPEAYSWSKDDTATKGCNNSKDFRITFCR